MIKKAFFDNLYGNCPQIVLIPNIQTGFLVERENSNGNKHDPVRYVIVDSLESTLHAVKVERSEKNSAARPNTHHAHAAMV